MADNDKDVMQQEVPPLPPKGEMVSDNALYLTQIANYRNAMAFTGARNPSLIWTSMVRDDSSTILYYRELEEKDDDVADALDSLKYSVTRRPRYVQPADDSQLAMEISDFIQAQLDGLPNFDDTLDCLLDMCGYGFSVQEMIFDVSMGQASLQQIHDCPQELFLFAERYRPQVGPLQLLDNPYGMVGTVAPEEKFVVSTFRSRARNRMGRPLLRSVFWPSWFKRNVLGFWTRYAEKGPGTAVVKYGDAASDSDKQNAADLAVALVENYAVAVPQNFQYDSQLLQYARNISPDVYEHLYQLMQYSIARRVLGQTLTSFGNEGGHGSNAQGQVHQDTLNLRSVAIAKNSASVVNRRIVRPLVLWNYGPDAPMPKYGFDIEEKEDLTARLSIDQGLQRMGLEMPKQYLRKKYDVPPPEEGDEIATPNAAAAEPALTTRETFSEREKKMDAVVEKDLKQFDAVMAQLKEESLKDYKVRVKEIANATKTVEA
jgi:phage gp29-like protein